MRPNRAAVYCLRFLGAERLDYTGVVDLGRANNGTVVIPIYKGVFFPINEKGANNYELFKAHCLAFYDGIDSIEYYLEAKGTFTFRVVE